MNIKETRGDEDIAYKDGKRKDFTKQCKQKTGSTN